MDTIQSPLTSLKQIREQALEKVKSLSRPRVALVAADLYQTIKGVNLAVQSGLIDPVLLGPKKRIFSMFEKLGIDSTEWEIINIPDEEESVLHAVGMVLSGEVSILLPGNISVPVFFQTLFSNDCFFRERGDFLSLVGVMEHPDYDGLLLLSDVGLVPNPTVEQGIRIIKNAIHVARLLGKQTIRVGLLAFEETATPQSPTTVAESIISEFFHHENDPSVVVEGPMRLDFALKPDAIPCIPTEGIEQGKADILIANNIHVGNAMYKAMLTLCGASSAPLVVGGQCPIALPSRSESPENVLNSIAISILDTEWQLTDLTR